MARVPGVQGAFAEGETIEEALFNCVDVVKMIAGYRAERGEPFSTTLGGSAPDVTVDDGSLGAQCSNKHIERGLGLRIRPAGEHVHSQVNVIKLGLTLET